jgi:hypothetical protein
MSECIFKHTYLIIRIQLTNLFGGTELCVFGAQAGRAGGGMTIGDGCGFRATGWGIPAC